MLLRREREAAITAKELIEHQARDGYLMQRRIADERRRQKKRALPRKSANDSMGSNSRSPSVSNDSPDPNSDTDTDLEVEVKQEMKSPPRSLGNKFRGSKSILRSQDKRRVRFA